MSQPVQPIGPRGSISAQSKEAAIRLALDDVPFNDQEIKFIRDCAMVGKDKINVADEDDVVVAVTVLRLLARIAQQDKELQAQRWRQVREEMPPKLKSVLAHLYAEAYPEMMELDACGRWIIGIPGGGTRIIRAPRPEDWWMPFPPLPQE